jgi:prepilin-type processing-associated H-X9-DG protein
MFTYAAEKDGFLPGATTWDREIAPYLGYTGVVNTTLADQIPVLKCPSDNVVRTSGKVRSYKPNTISNTDANMGVLAWTSSAKKESRRIHELPYPSLTILVTETFSADNVQFEKANSILGAPGWLTKISKVPAFPDGSFYHGPGQNYLFCDGHVELLIPLDGLKAVLPDWDGGRWRALPK